MIAAHFPPHALVAGVIAFAVTVVLVPFVRILAKRFALCDRPGPLKIHTAPVPRLGGAAIFFGIVAALIAVAPHALAVTWPFFVALALVWSAGFVDDLSGLAPGWRLAAQFSAGVVLWMGGWRLFENVFVGLLGNAILVAGFANAVNLLDGMDGIATGVSLIMSGTYLFLPAGSLGLFGRIVAGSAVGACIAFLPVNWPIADLFLGDCGSTLLGFLVAFLALDFYRNGHPAHAGLAFPVLVAALPLLDTLFAALRRLRAGESPLFGDRRHLYDLAATNGWKASQIAPVFYAITAAFGAIGLIGVHASARPFWVSTVLGVGLLLTVAIRLGSLRSDSGKGRAGIRSKCDESSDSLPAGRAQGTRGAAN